jgi:Domain of unknown function (DUF4865)
VTDTPGQLIMQYRIPLPADYDMAIIRERILTRGSALDERAGLICKAYCIRERGVHGALANEYAPFYVWADATAAADFLWHRSGFHGIVADFGRPVVRTWVPIERAAGAVLPTAVRSARIRTTGIAEDCDLAEVAAELAGRVRQISPATTQLSVAGIDPRTWQAVEFSTSADPGAAPGPGWSDYSVLHVSAPASSGRS